VSRALSTSALIPRRIPLRRRRIQHRRHRQLQRNLCQPPTSRLGHPHPRRRDPNRQLPSGLHERARAQ